MRCVLDFMEWKHKAVVSTRPLDRSSQYSFKMKGDFGGMHLNVIGEFN